MINYLLVFFGGGLGASLRHTVNIACAKCIGTAFPYGTFIINISGSTVMVLIAGYLAPPSPWRPASRRETFPLKFGPPWTPVML